MRRSATTNAGPSNPVAPALHPSPFRQQQLSGGACHPLPPSSTTGPMPSKPPSAHGLPPAYDRHTRTHQQPPTPPLSPLSNALPPKIHVRVPSRPGVVLVISTSRVTHVPGAARTFCDKNNTPAVGGNASAFRDSSLTLCPRYEHATPASLRHSRPGDTSVCALGVACAYVHADHRGASEYMPHERAQAHRYPRYPPGATVALAKPNAAAADEVFASSDLLRTRVLESERRPLSHCVHFASKGRCDRGERCYFAHVVVMAGPVEANGYGPPTPPTAAVVVRTQAEASVAAGAASSSVVVGAFPRTATTAPLKSREDLDPAQQRQQYGEDPRGRTSVTRRPWAHSPYDAVPVTSGPPPPIAPPALDPQGQGAASNQ